MTPTGSPTPPTQTRRLGRPVDTDSTDTRDRIVARARDRFATEGFEGTTNKAIADDAGVSSTALYHYFPSKADLYVAVCDSISIELAEVCARAKAQDATLESRLSALFAEVGTLGLRTPSTVGFIAGISAVVRKHPEVSRGTDAIGSRFRSLVVDLVATAQDKGTFAGGSSSEALADVVIAVLAGLGRLSARGEQHRHREAGEAFLRMVRAALRD